MRSLVHYLPEFVIVALLGAATGVTVLDYALWGIDPTAFAVCWGLATIASVSLFFAVRRSGADWHRELRKIFLISLIVAVVGVFAGYGNLATDEGRTTIAYGQEMVHLINPYTTQLTLNYQVYVFNVWQNSVTSVSYDTYLPLISFVQVPGTGATGYSLLCIAMWAGMVYVVRNDEFASLTLASPVVALVASNGFNDIPVLFLMTLSLRGWTGTKAKVVEYLTYGMKQFANVFWILFYLLQRQWLRAVLVVVITLAILAPFILWSPSGVYCQVMTLGLGPGCPSSGSRGFADLYDHWNYYLWPLWIYALFREGIHARLRWLRAHVIPPSHAASRDPDASKGADEVPLRTNGY